MTQGGKQADTPERAVGCSEHRGEEEEEAGSGAAVHLASPPASRLSHSHHQQQHQFYQSDSNTPSELCLEDTSDNSHGTQITNKDFDKNNNNNSDNQHANNSSSSGGEDVKSLLNFVSVATTDIKAALDKSAPCKRSVDHRKYLQRQLKRFSGSPHTLHGYSHQQHVPPSSPELYHQHQRADTPSHFPVTGARPDAIAQSSPRQDLWHYATLQKSAVTPGQVTPSNLVSSLNMSTTNHARMCRNENGQYARDRHKEYVQDRLFGDYKPDNVTSDEDESTTDKNSAVPLRQRQLPASFWKEPNIPKSMAELAKDGSHGLGPYPPVTLDVASKTIGYPTKDMIDSAYMRHWFAENPNSTGISHLEHPRKYLATDTTPMSPLTYASWNYSLLHTDTKCKHSNNARLLINGTSTHTPPPLISNHSAYNVGPPTLSARVGLYRSWDPSNLSLAQYAYSNGAGGASSNIRPPIWRPIPTKTLTAFPSRFHPFADVH